MKDLIKAKRLALKESQGEFGKRFGVSHAAISELERGITKGYTQEMIDLVFSGKIKEKCNVCGGTGWIERDSPKPTET